MWLSWPSSRWAAISSFTMQGIQTWWIRFKRSQLSLTFFSARTLRKVSEWLLVYAEPSWVASSMWWTMSLNLSNFRFTTHVGILRRRRKLPWSPPPGHFVPKHLIFLVGIFCLHSGALWNKNEQYLSILGKLFILIRYYSISFKMGQSGRPQFNRVIPSRKCSC